MGALLLQPHGFEGLGGVAEPLEADGPTVPNGPNVRVLVLSLHTASPASRGVRRQHDDLVADIFDLAHLDPDVLERVVYRTQGVFVGGDSSTCPRLDCAGWIYVLDVGMQQAQGCRRLAARQCLMNGPDDLHVLLRHRLLLEAEVGEGAVAVLARCRLRHHSSFVARLQAVSIAFARSSSKARTSMWNGSGPRRSRKDDSTMSSSACTLRFATETRFN